MKPTLAPLSESTCLGATRLQRASLVAAIGCAALLPVTLASGAWAQNTTPTHQPGPNGEVPAPDKHPTPPLTFPPSSACAFHGKPDCEQKIKQDALENKKYGRTGVIGGAPATSNGETFGSNAQTGVQPLGGMSSGSSGTIAPSSPGLGGGSSNPNSIGNSSSGTPNPSGTGNGVPQLPSSGGSVGGSVPSGGGSSSGTSGGGL